METTANASPITIIIPMSIYITIVDYFTLMDTDTQRCCVFSTIFSCSASCFSSIVTGADQSFHDIVLHSACVIFDCLLGTDAAATRRSDCGGVVCAVCGLRPLCSSFDPMLPRTTEQ